MYLALARKYRPQDFSGVIGQEAVIHTLGNAIAQDRIHHAYLFCGARGIGKTSIARIYAKSLNCEKGPTLTPCQQCDPCKSITNGSSLDVMEIDGASHTGVDNIRELREQVKYLPNSCKYKIYIIDEVHMLSTSAFNALLKTLEEPPVHVIFMFATTEPHKIPITILSRCQRYDLRKVNSTVLIAHLKTVLKNENVKAEDSALQLVADCAQGSVRDAMSLLDQAIGFHPEGLKEQEIRQLLGLADRIVVQNTFAELVKGNVSASLNGLNEMDTLGLDLKLFAEDLLKMYRHLILLLSTQSLPENLSPAEQDFYQELKTHAELSLAMAQYQILFQTIKEMAFSEFQKTTLEMAFVKLAQAGQMLALPQLVEELKARAKGAPAKAARPQVSVRSTAAERSRPQPAAQPANTKPTIQAKDWYELVQWLIQKKPPLGALLNDAVPINYSNQKIEVGFPKESPSHNMMIERKNLVEELLQQHFGQKVDFLISDLSDQKKKS